MKKQIEPPNPSSFVNQIIRIQYEQSVSLTVKTNYIAYCKSIGVYASDYKLMVMPDTFFINMNLIELLIWTEPMKGPGYWNSANNTDTEQLKVSPSGGLQIDHQSVLKKLGMPWDLSAYLWRPFIFLTESDEKISGIIANICLVRTKKDFIIRLTPRNSHIYTKAKDWFRIHYFELRPDGSWQAVNRATTLDSGKLSIF